MGIFVESQDRKIIPRWRSFGETQKLKELESVVRPRAHQQVITDFLLSKIIDWRDNRTVGHAADLVGAGLVLGREAEVIEAARFLLRSDPNISPWAKELAEQALKSPGNTDMEINLGSLSDYTLHNRVSTLRRLLRTEPRDPFTWVELSRAYATVGLSEPAERSMTVALNLSNNNRFILRSASRLWVHLRDPEKAHDIIVRAEGTRFDPWLMAAEIAIGSITKRKPRFVKAARRMLKERRFSPVHVSELASAVATLELGSGALKNSRKMFVQSLEQPTENSIAQAVWASRESNAIRVQAEFLDRPNTFEARARSFYSQSHWKDVINECERWRFDQPFSSGPCEYGSYVAAIALEDHETSRKFTKWGLKANPSDFILLNNMAFACINLNEIKEATGILSRIHRLRLSDRDRVVLQATQGLLAFRTGAIVVGRQLYTGARSRARKMHGEDGKKLLASASVFQAIEEISHGFSGNETLLVEARQAIKQVSDPIYRVLETKLDNVITQREERNTKPTR